MRALETLAAAALAVLVVACGEKPSSPAEAPRAEPPVPVAPAPAAPEEKVAAPPAAPGPATSASPAEAPAPPAKPTAAPAPAPAAPVAKPAPTSAGPAAQPAPASAHAKVGADKCKMCHRLQHQSWAESAHASKGLDCEACHGNGGDYWPAAVMRDRAKAVAAGLVLPGVARCRTCHASADAALLPKAHAHKAR
jgi:outer membrane biosynthesis protein TonB